MLANVTIPAKQISIFALKSLENSETIIPLRSIKVTNHFSGNTEDPMHNFSECLKLAQDLYPFIPKHQIRIKIANL